MDSSPMQSTRPLRPMSFGEILEGAFTLYRDNFQEFLSIAAVILVPTIIVLGIIAAVIVGIASQGGGVSTGTIVAGSIVGVIVGLILLAANILVSGALAVAIGRRFIGLPSTVGQAFQASEGRFLALLGTSLLLALIFVVIGIVGALLAAVLPIVGALLAIVAFLAIVFLGVRWCLFAPVVMLEGAPGGMPALERSAGLVAGHWWRTLGVVFVAAIIVGIVTNIIAAIVRAIIPNTIVDQIVSELIGIIATPYSSSVLVLLYFDYRVRKEGYDAAALQGNIASLTGGAPGPALQM